MKEWLKRSVRSKRKFIDKAGENKRVETRREENVIERELCKVWSNLYDA